jgi:hypothetical protein
MDPIIALMAESDLHAAAIQELQALFQPSQLLSTTQLQCLCDLILKYPNTCPAKTIIGKYATPEGEIEIEKVDSKLAVGCLVELLQHQNRELEKDLTFESYRHKDLNNQLKRKNEEIFDLTKENEQLRGDRERLSVQLAALPGLKAAIETMQIEHEKLRLHYLESLKNTDALESIVNKDAGLTRKLFSTVQEYARDPKYRIPPETSTLIVNLLQSNRSLGENAESKRQKLALSSSSSSQNLVQ